jgi:hypothetical protein
VILAILAILAVAAGACARVAVTEPGRDGGGSGGAGVPPPSSDAAADRQETSSSRPPDAQLIEAGEMCTTTVTCTPANGRYCGVIGNGCRSTLDCGGCPGSGQVCESGVCVEGPGCTPLACQAGSGRYCGRVGDGCGRAMDCGACAEGQICSTTGLCVAGAGCVPLTCNAGGGFRFCGMIGDGCGGTLDCGGCTAPATCGGRRTPGVCGDPNCQPITCMPAGGGRYCGVIGDGCGGTVDCGTACPSGLACGAAPAGGGMAIPNVCPGTTGGTCTGLACMVPTCTGTAKTTLSGTVRDPAGRIPLYNVVVYVPNAALDPIPEGASCDRCSVQLSGKPIATALTDTAGRFVLENVPAGSNIPLVIQIGKWRRQVTIPSVTRCVDNPITDANLTRLPRNKGEGHIPKMALTTGSSDALECMLRKLGIADAEFTTDAGNGRVHLYVGGDPAVALDQEGPGAARFAPNLNAGVTFPHANMLWRDPTKLLGYDILLMACEGSQFGPVKMPHVANIKRYADSGGRIFGSHLHFYWLRSGPAPWPMTANYIGVGQKPANPSPATIDTSFPKGAALADWMMSVGGSTTRGQIQLYEPQHSVAETVAPTQRWIYMPMNPMDEATPKRVANQYLTFNTPVEAAADAQCGRVVHTDIHVNAAPVPSGENEDSSRPDQPFPTGCTAMTASAQEKALEFLFFDLSACVQPDTDRPVPPPVPPPGVPNTPPTATPPPPPLPPPPPPPPPPPIP